MNMTKLNITIAFAFLLIAVGAASTFAQAPKSAPAYKLSAINITPFDEASGKFQDVVTTTDSRSFFNDLSISLFVTIEISGQAGSFETGRKVQVTVMEGKKVKFTKTEQVGLIGEGGKYYMPVWLYSSMCDEVKITAKLIGQKTVSTMTRKVLFECGE
jgi:hypothetical protein